MKTGKRSKHSKSVQSNKYIQRVRWKRENQDFRNAVKTLNKTSQIMNKKKKKQAYPPVSGERYCKK